MKRKKKKLAANLVEGSHLAEGTTPIRPRGSAVNANRGSSSESPEAVPPLPPKATGRLTKQPSVVREDPEEDHVQAKPQTEKTAPLSMSNLEALASSTKPSQSANRATDASNPITNKTLQVFKHNPPERSMSPTKSAMKRPSSRGNSPAARSSSATRQDASDTISNTSDDQRVPTQKRRVRVSFDDDAVVVGQAAETVNSSPVVLSPQNKDPAKRGWFKQDATADDVIQPVPALPSFGSVRGSKGSKEILGTSSDHAVGDIVNQSLGRSQHSMSDPLPPEVTSVEGTGHHSDSEDETPLPSQNGHATPPTDAKPTDAVPTIAIMPATPNETQEDKTLHMPGEFPDEAESMAEAKKPERSNPTPGTVGIAEPTPEVSPGPDAVAKQIAEPAAHRPVAKEEDSDDSSDSIYSDAEEEAVDVEGDGFGSINAIVDSPVLPSSEFRAAVEGDDQRPSSPKDAAGTSKDSETSGSPISESGIPEANGLQGPATSESKRFTGPSAKPSPHAPTRQRQEPNEDRPMRTSMRGSPDTRTSPSNSRGFDPSTNPRRDAQDSRLVRPPQSDRSNLTMAKPKTLRAQRGAETDASPIPKSTMRSSMRESNQKEPVRPQSQGGQTGPTPALSDDPFTSARTMKPGRFAPPMPKLQRQTSEGSDSSSSFKKSSRRNRSAEGRYTMRRSMRAPPEPSSHVKPGPRGPDLPPASPRSNMAGPRMRTSLRGPQAPKARETSPRFSMRGMSTITESKAPKASRPASSRIASMSDDERVPQRFTSRFADSSDEEEPTALHLAPVRGIPRTGDQSDSTDLEDSDDKDALRPGRIRAAQVPVPAADALNGLDVGRIPSKGPAGTDRGRSTEGKRKSWFGLRGRKKDESKIGKADTESAARLDTHLARSRQERINIPEAQDDSSLQEGTLASKPTSPLPSPRAGRLTRRNAPQRMASDSFPFQPGPSVATTDSRPMTSDGKARGRPAMGARQPSGVSVSSRTGKKKRFPMLRKAFGLHD